MDDDEDDLLPTFDDIALAALTGVMASGMEPGPGAARALMAAVEYISQRNKFIETIAPLHGVIVGQ